MKNYLSQELLEDGYLELRKICLWISLAMMICPWSICKYNIESNKVYGSYIMWYYALLAGISTFILAAAALLFVIIKKEGSFFLVAALLDNTYILFSKLHKPLTVFNILIEIFLAAAFYLELKGKKKAKDEKTVYN